MEMHFIPNQRVLPSKRNKTANNNLIGGSDPSECDYDIIEMEDNQNSADIESEENHVNCDIGETPSAVIHDNKKQF